MIYTYCPECGFLNEEDAKFCNNCRKELAELNSTQNLPAKCPYCNNRIDSNANKCKHCGQLLKETENYNSMIVLGYIFSFITGFIGLILSIYLVTRKNKNVKIHGIIIFFLSIFLSIIWAAAIYVAYVMFIAPPAT